MLGHGYISTEERGSDCAGDAFSTHQGLLVRERYDNRPWSNLRVTAFCPKATVSISAGSYSCVRKVLRPCRSLLSVGISAVSVSNYLQLYISVKNRPEFKARFEELHLIGR